MAELPAAKRSRFLAMGLPRDDVLILAEDLETAGFFDAVLDEGAPAKLAANWVVGDIMAHCKASMPPPARKIRQKKRKKREYLKTNISNWLILFSKFFPVACLAFYATADKARHAPLRQ